MLAVAQSLSARLNATGVKCKHGVVGDRQGAEPLWCGITGLLDCLPQHEARGLPHLGARLGPFDDAEGLPVPLYLCGGLPLFGGGTAQGSPYAGVILGGVRGWCQTA